MLRLLTDENFNQRILRGLWLRFQGLDCLVVQDAGLAGFSDEWLLELAAIERRVIVTHDVNTMLGHAVARLGQALPMPGLIVVPARLEIGRAIEELGLLITCSNESDLKNRICYLPL
jgi:Domain of unknown function (DUF5615)